jgi:hypothetical protein
MLSSSVDSVEATPQQASNSLPVHELSVKQLVLTILNTELLFESINTGARSEHKKHRAAAAKTAQLAASFIKSSRNSIIGSLSHLGINQGSSGTMGSEASDTSSSAAAKATILQQNLTNAAASVPKGSSKKSPQKPPTPKKPDPGGRLQQAADTEILMKTRLGFFAAEDDGTAMDDLPEFTATTNILHSGACFFLSIFFFFFLFLSKQLFV